MKHSTTALAIIVVLSLFVPAACGGRATATSQPARSTEPAPTRSSESSTSGDYHEASESSEREEHSQRSESGERGENTERSESGEHGEDDEHAEGPGEGEESGAQYGLDETYDEIRAGARLIISLDQGGNIFTGTVENTTSDTLKRVRVEVHLSNGIELGPTTPVDLAPGDSANVTLEASALPFETWNAHPEVG